MFKRTYHILRFIIATGCYITAFSFMDLPFKTEMAVAGFFLLGSIIQNSKWGEL